MNNISLTQGRSVYPTNEIVTSNDETQTPNTTQAFSIQVFENTNTLTNPQSLNGRVSLPLSSPSISNLDLTDEQIVENYLNEWVESGSESNKNIRKKVADKLKRHKVTREQLVRLSLNTLAPNFTIEDFEKRIDFFYFVTKEIPNTLESTIQEWIEIGGTLENKENRIEAAERIKNCYLAGESELNLEKLGLTSLPDIFKYDDFIDKLEIVFLKNNELTDLPPSFAYLNELERLYLSNNKFTQLPKVVYSLTELTELDIDNNQISELSDDIENLNELVALTMENNHLKTLPNSFKELVKLQALLLGNNYFKEIPEVFEDFTDLKVIILNDNKELSVLPESLGKCENLEVLFFENTNVSSLPDSLQNCTKLWNVRFENSNITQKDCDDLLQKCKEKSYYKDLQDLIDRLKKVLPNTNNPENFSFFRDMTQFSYSQISLITEWLSRVQKMADYKRNKSSLAETLYNILLTLKHSQDFKNAFFAIVEGDQEGCGDRTAMSLNLIYTEWKLHTELATASDKNKLHLLEGIAKTITLRSLIAKIIEELKKTPSTIHTESSEIFLYYETTFKASLGLITAGTHMLHSQIGKLENIDEENLKMQVMKNYIETFLEFPCLDNILENNLDFKTEYLERKNAILQNAEKEMAAADGSDDDEVTYENSEMYVNKLLEIKNSRELNLVKLKKEFVEKIITT